MDVYLATLLIWPFTLGHVSSIDFASVPMSTWWETDFVVFFGTYISYICMMVGQQTHRPTDVSVYNYLQPQVKEFDSKAAGVGKRQRSCWPCCVQDLTSLGRHSRILWRLVRGKIEIET